MHSSRRAILVHVAFIAALLRGCAAEAPRASHDARTASHPCRMTLDAQGAPDVRARLLAWPADFIACPFTDNAARLDLLVADRETCTAPEILGLPVAQVTPLAVGELEAAAACSAGVSLSAKPITDGPKNTYVWVLPAPPTARTPRPGEAAFEYSRTTVLLARTGLPITYRNRISGLICFETAAGEPSPLEMLKSVGYRPPRGLREQAFPGRRCPEVAVNVFGRHLPWHADEPEPPLTPP